MSTVTVRYFAWVREKVGRSEEQLSPPATVETITDLIDWLKTQGAEYEVAFANASVIRAAIDQRHVKADTRIAGARDVAFFPPVTGG
jgi:sulfur-carrier protein